MTHTSSELLEARLLQLVADGLHAPVVLARRMSQMSPAAVTRRVLASMVKRGLLATVKSRGYVLTTKGRAMLPSAAPPPMRPYVPPAPPVLRARARDYERCPSVLGGIVQEAA